MTSHRRHHLLIILSAIFLLSPRAYAQNDARDTLRLDQAQFKATHNSYLLAHSPQVQIDEYDVWEIELDFGMTPDSKTFLVGHDDPDPKHGLTTLGDWVRNILSADALKHHPIILKLEAKTTGPCEIFRFQTFTCSDNWPKNWQNLLVDSLNAWIDSENWITYRTFRDDLKRNWPKVSELAGKIIVTLQDSNDNRDINLKSDYFFIREIAGLRAVWPPIRSADDYESAVQSGANRLTMDEAYENVGVGPSAGE